MNNLSDYWDINPCNYRHSSSDNNTKKYYEEITRKKYKVENHIPKFANFGNYKNKKVLEVACGLGTAAQSFAENGAIYTGLDFSNKSLSLAKKRFELFSLKGKFIHEDILNFESDEKYDLVYAFGVIHHIIDADKAVNNIYNLIKPGGEFKLMLYATNSWKNFRIKKGLDQYEAVENVPYARTYTKEEVYLLLSKFENIIIDQKHIFPYKIEEYKQGKYIKEDYFEAMDDKLFKSLENNLGWHLCITCQKPFN